jgi:excisionase family DNA binding protein
MTEVQLKALTETEVAQRLGLSVATLRAWRMRHKGPRFVRFGRAVRYLAEDIEQFIAASIVTSQADGTERDKQSAREEAR